MKRLFQLFYAFIIVCILFNANDVLAFTTTLDGNKKIDAGSSFTVTMNLSGATDLIALDAALSYDSNKLELTSFKGQGGWQTQVAKKIVGANSNGLNGSGSIVTLTFKAKSSFVAGESTTIWVTNVKGSNSNVERQTGNAASIEITVKVPKSTNNNLSNLSVDGTLVSGFSADKTSYDLGTKDISSINITAIAEDGKASISGTGSKKVNYGKNTFNVVVTAENGSKKTYSIIVTRPDNRDTDNTLSSLSASSLNLKFNKNTTNYSFNVENSVKSITINAKASSGKATVSGTGVKTLKDYVNTFNVVVTAENGSKKTYTIKVIRKDAEGNLGFVSKDNTLKGLSVEGYSIQFSKDTLDYSIEVDNLVESIEVKAQVNHSGAVYEVVGNTDLKVGTNAVKINVTAESGDVKTYIINVTRKSDAPTTTLGELSNIIDKTTAKEVIIEIKDDKTILDDKTLEVIKNSKKTVIINNYSNNIINYSWSIDGNNIGNIKNIETFITFTSDNYEAIDRLTNHADSVYLNFKHQGKLPKNTKIKVYVGNKYQDGAIVNIYYYNGDKNKMDEQVKDLKVVGGYVEFDIEHCSEYIITRSQLRSPFNVFIPISIIEAMIILGYIVYIKFKPKKAKKK